MTQPITVATAIKTGPSFTNEFPTYYSFEYSSSSIALMFDTMIVGFAICLMVTFFVFDTTSTDIGQKSNALGEKVNFLYNHKYSIGVGFI